MKIRGNFKLAALGAILSAMLVVPALAQQGNKGKTDIGERFKEQRIQIIRQLKLPPEKEKALLGVEDKYVGMRKNLITSLQTTRDALEDAMAAATPDSAKVKNLVDTLTSDQDKLFDSFKDQRNEELGLLTPVEQARYLLAMEKWRRQMMEKPKRGATK